MTTNSCMVSNTRIDVNIAFTINGKFEAKKFTFMVNSDTHIDGNLPPNSTLINAVNETIKSRIISDVNDSHFQGKIDPEISYNLPFKFDVKIPEIRVEIKHAFIVPHKAI